MARAKGRNLITYIGAQADKDTLATSFLKVLGKNNTVSPSYEKIQSEALDGNAFVKKGAVVGLAVSGNTDLECTKDQLEAVMPFAGFVETVPDTSDIWKLQSTIASYATIIAQLTDVAEERTFKGCKINSFGIELAMKSYVGLNLEWTGLDYTLAQSLSAPTASDVADPRIKTTSPNIVINVAGADKTAMIKSLSFTLSNNIQVDEVLGQMNPEDCDSELMEARVTFTAVFDKTLHNDMITKLKNETDFAIDFDLDTDFNIKLPNVEVDSVSAPVNNGDKLELTFEVIGKYDATEQTSVVIDLSTGV